MGSEKSLQLQPNMDSFSFSNMGSQQSDFDLESTDKRQDGKAVTDLSDQIKRMTLTVSQNLIFNRLIYKHPYYTKKGIRSKRTLNLRS